MNTTQNKAEAKTVEANAEVVNENANGEPQASVVDTIFDVGTAWAEYGLGYGKFALESTAKALQRTAAALAAVQERLKKDAA